MCNEHKTVEVSEAQWRAFDSLIDANLGDCEVMREINTMQDELMGAVGCGGEYADKFAELCGCIKTRLEGKSGWCPEVATHVEVMCGDS